MEVIIIVSLIEHNIVQRNNLLLYFDPLLMSHLGSVFTVQIGQVIQCYIHSIHKRCNCSLSKFHKLVAFEKSHFCHFAAVPQWRQLIGSFYRFVKLSRTLVKMTQLALHPDAYFGVGAFRQYPFGYGCCFQIIPSVWLALSVPVDKGQVACIFRQKPEVVGKAFYRFLKNFQIVFDFARSGIFPDGIENFIRFGAVPDLFYTHKLVGGNAEILRNGGQQLDIGINLPTLIPPERTLPEYPQAAPA